MSDTVKITQHILGLEPYVLLTAYQGDEGEDDLRIGVEFGGGPKDLDDARGLILLALPSMGVTPEELAAVAEEALDAEPPTKLAGGDRD